MTSSLVFHTFGQGVVQTSSNLVLCTNTAPSQMESAQMEVACGKLSSNIVFLLQYN